MSRTDDYYREEREREERDREAQERYDFELQWAEEQWYHEQMELLKEDEDNLNEIPSTEEDLFRQIREDEINESEDIYNRL